MLIAKVVFDQNLVRIRYPGNRGGPGTLTGKLVSMILAPGGH